MVELTLVGAVIAGTEFIKRLVKTLVGFEVGGELTIAVAFVLGALAGLAGVEGVTPLQGAIIGAAAAGGVKVVKSVNN